MAKAYSATTVLPALVWAATSTLCPVHQKQQGVVLKPQAFSPQSSKRPRGSRATKSHQSPKREWSLPASEPTHLLPGS